MEFDYPAAHSMDSSWYAVDKHGHVALFVTGAGGAMPGKAHSPDAAEMMEEADLWDEIKHNPDREQMPDSKHLFVYQTGPLDECLADRYHLKQKPKKPVHVDQLPREARDAVKATCFETLDFSKTKVFQPIELTECVTWDPAYLASDGKTVRPVPGREPEYTEFVEELGGIEEGLVIEGLEDEEEDE